MAMYANREDALSQLLIPIVWDMSSSIRARQNLVTARHNAVHDVYPFLKKKEKAQADAWFANESHSDLWE